MSDAITFTNREGRECTTHVDRIVYVVHPTSDPEDGDEGFVVLEGADGQTRIQLAADQVDDLTDAIAYHQYQYPTPPAYPTQPPHWWRHRPPQRRPIRPMAPPSSAL